MHLIEAIELENHEVSVSTADKINSLSIKGFLEQLLKKYPKGRCLHLIWDKVEHHRGEDIKTFIEKEKRLQVHALPSYSPNLNPMKRLCKVMHEKVTLKARYEHFLKNHNLPQNFKKG